MTIQLTIDRIIKALKPRHYTSRAGRPVIAYRHRMRFGARLYMVNVKLVELGVEDGIDPETGKLYSRMQGLTRSI